MSDSGKKKLLFIVNPNSGTGRSENIEVLINQLLDDRQFEIEVLRTSKRGDAEKFAHTAVQQQVDAVIAVGGDGTVNEVGAQLVGSPILLGIIPTGSGNGLARHMGIPMSVKKSIMRITQMKASRIDTGKIGDYAFLNVAGIGFDAKISHAFADRERRGFKGYVKVILTHLLSSKPQVMTLTLNGKTQQQKVFMLSVANGSQFGNNARIAPNASVTDGKLDVCAVKNIGFLKALPFAWRLMTGGLKESSNYSSIQTDALTVEGTGGLAHVDGEPVQIEEKIQIQIKPASLNLIH